MPSKFGPAVEVAEGSKFGPAQLAQPAPEGGDPSTVEKKSLGTVGGITEAMQRGGGDAFYAQNPQLRMVQAGVDSLNPMSLVKAISEPVNTFQMIRDQFKKKAAQSTADEQAGNYGKAVLHGVEAIPLVGPMVERAADRLEKGEYPELIGEGVAAYAAPKISKEVVRVAAKVPGAVRKMMERGSEKIYQSGLKPGVADAAELGDVRRVVKTALQNDLPINEGGVTKLRDLIGDYQTQVRDAVSEASAAGKSVSRDAVGTRADDAIFDMSIQANPAEDVAAALKVKRGFEKAHPAQMSPDYAQSVKTGTNARLQGKYGQMATAAIETEKALVRGFKEELERAAPELKLLNSKEGELLGLQPALERAVRRAGNANIVSLDDAAAAAAGDIVLGPKGGALAFLGKLTGSPELKSKLALGIYKASQKSGKSLPMPVAVARAGALLAGIRAQQQAEEKAQKPSNRAAQ